MCVFEYLRFGQGLIPGAPLGAAIDVPRGVVRGGDLPLLGRLCLQMREGRPFLPPLSGGELLSSSSSSSVWEEWISASSDVTSEVPLQRRPLLVSLAFFLAYFSGAW